jgi:hypothetical protein
MSLLLFVFGLRFSEYDRKDVTITSFPNLSFTYDTGISGVGAVTTTITLHAPCSGTYNPQTRVISLELNLHVAHSTSLAGPSDIELTLTGTIPPNPDQVSLDGGGVFRGGTLNDESCSTNVTGAMVPVP